MARHNPQRSLTSLVAVGALLLGLNACSDAAAPSDGTSAAAGGFESGGGGTYSGGGFSTSGGVGGSAAGGGVSGSAMISGGAAGVGGSSAGSSGAGGLVTGGAGGSSAGAGGTSGSNNAGSGGTAGGGAAVYHPCPTNGDACRVMPLGDSITDGCCGETKKSMGASYRLELFHLSLMNNKRLTFVGSSQNGPNTVDNQPFPRNHEGHSGWTIADKPAPGPRDGLQDQMVGWLTNKPANMPHIVTLMIGTNDIDTNYDLPNAPKRLATLVDTITGAAPNALVVLAQMVPTRKDDENTRVRAFNDAMPALVKARADAGKHVVLVDIYGAYVKDPNYKTAL